MKLVRRADTASFIQCHVNAFDYFGGVSRRCLYDNSKVVALGRDEEGRTEWNRRMLDFSLMVGFDGGLRAAPVPSLPGPDQGEGGEWSQIRPGQPLFRPGAGSLAQPAFHPSLRFTDDADLNRQGLQWCHGVANRRTHGTTHRIPAEMLAEEQANLCSLPERGRLAPYLREDRRVARDGYVHWEGSRYGVPWQWCGATVQVGQRLGTVEI